jgi:hypothetical protein
MSRLAVAVLAAAACGDPGAGSVMPDASPSALIPGCAVLDHPTQLKSPADFAPAVAGTLASWDPEGRWFITGAFFGQVSSVRLDHRDGQLVLDHETPASFDATEVFARSETPDGNGGSVIVAERISNLAADGSLRLERGSCSAGTCVRCTARLVRAAHLPGEVEADHLERIGELRDPGWGPGYTFNVRVAGTLAYLIRQDGLHVIDTADPAHPVELGSYRRPELGYSNDVKLVDAGARRYAILADTPVDVVDVTDPRAPVLAATIPESSHTLAVEPRDGKVYAYLANYDGVCPIYDVTDPTHAVKLGAFNTGASLMHDLSVDHGVAYLNAWERGFLAVDYTAPATPRLLGAWPHTPAGASHSSWPFTAAGRHLALHGDEGYNAHLDIVDVEPESPTFLRSIASWQTRPHVSIHNLMAFGSKAYFTHYQDGVRVLELGDPLHPRQVGYYNTWDPQGADTTSHFFEGAVGLDVDLARKLIFVADSPRGLIILADRTP